MARVKKRNDTIRLLDEAVALERAGGTWKQPHAAAVTGYGVSFLRTSDCPKHSEEGHGPKGRPVVVYVPAEVRAWKAARLLTAKAS